MKSQMKNLRMTRFGSHSQILTLTTLKTIVEFDPNTNLKIFDLPNNKFKSILNFQMKYMFPNTI